MNGKGIKTAVALMGAVSTALLSAGVLPWPAGPKAVVTFDPEVTDPDTIAESITQCEFEATMKKG